MVRPWYRRRWLVTLVSVVAIVWVGNGLGGDPRAGTGPTAAPSGAATASGPASAPRSASPAASPAAASTGERPTALALLATLPVKGRAPRTGYDRDQFGPAWLDADRNGCDTRGDILRRDLTGLSFRPGTHGCVVESGVLADPYTAARIDYVRGNDSVDVDHVVSLSNAWQTGAFGWDIRKRAALANDPMNLLAVDMAANRQKGDGDTATWLPPNKPFRCAYVARQVSVKAKYRLWLTPAERDAMDRVLRTCGTQRAWSGGAPIIAPVNVRVPVRSTAAPRLAGTAGTAGRTYYRNCDAVRAAGAAPIHRGEPGYAAHLDRDDDGTGCE